ncbi:MAG: AI-2E family transporter [Sulfuricella sp.]|nr:AI-2E family transporter [Sulfuricella sp.]
MYNRPAALTASYLLAATALLVTLKLSLLPALLAGLLVYHLTHGIAPRIPRLQDSAARMLVVALISAVMVLTLIAATLGTLSFTRADSGGLPGLLAKMAEILEHSRNTLPPTLVDYLPQDIDELRDKSVAMLREHADELKAIGKETAVGLVHVLIGMIVGAMLALHTPSGHTAPLSAALLARSVQFSRAFRDVVFAQGKIAAVNAFLTALYLGVILPLAGVKLPFVFTLILLTFVTGLIPVLGNILSNTVIVVVSLGYSLPVAGASLLFLVVVHKLEYFLNARIVGSQIHAKSWELLIAMLTMEAAFGLPGIVAAPVYYAWMKAELREKALI